MTAVSNMWRAELNFEPWSSRSCSSPNSTTCPAIMRPICSSKEGTWTWEKKWGIIPAPIPKRESRLRRENRRKAVNETESLKFHNQACDTISSGALSRGASFDVLLHSLVITWSLFLFSKKASFILGKYASSKVRSRQRPRNVGSPVPYGDADSPSTFRWYVARDSRRKLILSSTR
jgi:hypothetical protein